MGRGFGGGNPREDEHLSVGDRRKPGEIWHKENVDWNRWKRRGCRPSWLRWPFRRKVIPHG